MDTKVRYTEREMLEATFTSGEPLVSGLIAEGRNVLLVAPKKHAKSLLSLQLALCLAHGKDFLEHWKVPKPRRVVYYDFENIEEDVQSNLRRLRSGLGIDSTNNNLVLRKVPYLRLGTEAGVEELAKALEQDRPDLLILDPFYRLLVGSINKDDVVGPVTGVLLYLRQKYGFATWLPHHEHRLRRDQYGAEYEDAAERYAGNWLLTAWCDTMLGYHLNLKKSTAALTLYFARARPGPDGAEWSVELQMYDTPESLLFAPSGAQRLTWEWQSIKHMGLSLRQLGEMYGIEHPEQVRRLLEKLE